MDNKQLLTVKSFIYISLAAVLMFVDKNWSTDSYLKTYVNSLATPVYHAVDWPRRSYQNLSGWFIDKQQQQEINDQLRIEKSLTQARLLRLDILEKENEHLQELLTASKSIKYEYRLAKIINANLNAFIKQVVVNRGSRDQVYLGQSVIDQYGIVGQVTDLSLNDSVVTLITNLNHIIPVENQRNNLRSIIYGTGDDYLMQVRYMGLESDLKVGDRLISSGLGGRFPEGYPVAQITEVSQDRREPFLTINAKPLAHLSQGHNVILLWPKKQIHQESEVGVGDHFPLDLKDY